MDRIPTLAMQREALHLEMFSHGFPPEEMVFYTQKILHLDSEELLSVLNHCEEIKRSKDAIPNEILVRFLSLIILLRRKKFPLKDDDTILRESLSHLYLSTEKLFSFVDALKNHEVFLDMDNIPDPFILKDELEKCGYTDWFPYFLTGASYDASNAIVAK